MVLACALHSLPETRLHRPSSQAVSSLACCSPPVWRASSLLHPDPMRFPRGSQRSSSPSQRRSEAARPNLALFYHGLKSSRSMLDPPVGKDGGGAGGSTNRPQQRQYTYPSRKLFTVTYYTEKEMGTPTHSRKIRTKTDQSIERA